jgi:hypothetical protein
MAKIILPLIIITAALATACGSGFQKTTAETMESAQSSKLTVRDCLTAVPDNVTVREVLSLARERRILSNVLSPESCQLVVKNLELEKGASGKITGRFESIEKMRYEARKLALKGTQSAPAAPANLTNILSAEQGSSEGRTCGLQISMVSYATSDWAVPRIYPSFKFFVSSEQSTLPVINDSNMVSNLSTESFEGALLGGQIVTNSAQSVNGYKYFVKFDGARKITSFGLVSQSGLKKTIKWECNLEK